MYVLGEQPAYANALIDRLQTLTGRLLEGLEPCGPTLELEDGADLDTLLDPERLYAIDSGLVYASLHQRALFYLQDGDLLGLGPTAEALPCSYSTRGALRLVPYARSAALTHISADPQRQEWLVEYLSGQHTLACDAVTRLKQPEYRSSNGFKQVEAGHVLINQGDDADHVFVVIEGHAEAFVDGQKVGDVAKEEIFGAMAVFTQEKRSATVIAREASTVMLIPKDQFLNLTQTNPRIAHSLIESMARRIDALNKQLTGTDQDA